MNGAGGGKPPHDGRNRGAGACGFLGLPALAGGHFGDFDLDAKLDLAQHGVEA